MKHFILENVETHLPELHSGDVDFLSSLGRGISVRNVHGRLFIHADNVVGTVALPSGHSIEIKPKIGIVNLFRLLTHVSELYVPFEDISSFDEDRGIFEVLAATFCDELPKVVRRGLRKDYVPVFDLRQSLRGKIDSKRYSRTIADRPGLLPCQFSELSFQSLENRIVAAAAHRLSTSPMVSARRKKELVELVKHLPQLTAASLTSSDFKRLSFGRHNAHYKRILSISKLIFEQSSFASGDGLLSSNAFLIELWRVFERYISRFLDMASREVSLKVEPQNPMFLDREKKIRCKPDIVVRDLAGTPLCVADTKYKTILENRLVESDVYQCLAYLHILKCESSYLLYPSLTDSTGPVGEIQIENRSSQYRVVPYLIPIDDDQRCYDACKEFLEMVGRNAFNTNSRDRETYLNQGRAG